MTERLPDNLSMLSSKFTKEAVEHILPGETFHNRDVDASTASA